MASGSNHCSSPLHFCWYIRPPQLSIIIEDRSRLLLNGCRLKPEDLISFIRRIMVQPEQNLPWLLKRHIRIFQHYIPKRNSESPLLSTITLHNPTVMWHGLPNEWKSILPLTRTPFRLIIPGSWHCMSLLTCCRWNHSIRVFQRQCHLLPVSNSRVRWLPCCQCGILRVKPYSPKLCFPNQAGEEAPVSRIHLRQLLSKMESSTSMISCSTDLTGTLRLITTSLDTRWLHGLC